MLIGILKADSVLEQFQNEFGDYPHMFERLLAGKGRMEFRTYDVIQQVYPRIIDECDAYIITGSRTSVYDNEPWIDRLRDYVVTLHENRIPLIGICYGHQMIAHALGGKTQAADAGWGVGVHDSEVVKKERFMEPALDEFSLIVSHKDQVTRLPDEAILLARSDFCPYAMFRIGEHILAFQGHPEFCRGYSKALIEMRRNILSEQKFNEGIESLHKQTDEAVIARWIVKFIHASTSESYEDAPRGFETARRRAGEILKDENKTSELLDRATLKAGRKKNALGDVWNDLIRLFRLLRAWRSGEYQGVSWRTLLLVTTGIIYFVTPFDVIPDFIAMFGFLDDATIITFVMSKIRDELEAFTEWEELNR